MNSELRVGDSVRMTNSKKTPKRFIGVEGLVLRVYCDRCSVTYLETSVCIRKHSLIKIPPKPKRNSL